jgi:MYXO-CTERM domain-containing protein
MLLAATACNEDRIIAMPEGQVIDSYYRESTQIPVDILWVVDDSGSMAQEQAALGAGFQYFIEHFVDLALDFRIAVVTTDVDNKSERGQFQGTIPVLTPDTPGLLSEFANNVNVGITGSDPSEEQSFEAARLAFTPGNLVGPNSGFLRREALLAIIFVSDEDDFSMWGSPGGLPHACADDFGDSDSSDCAPIARYIEAFEAIKGGHTDLLMMGAIAGPTVNTCSYAWPGYRYEELIAQMGGLFESICQQDFDAILDRLGERISSKAVKPLGLTYPPKEETIQVWVDGDLVPSGSDTWVYDADEGAIRVAGHLVPGQCTEIQVQYIRESSEPLITTAGAGDTCGIPDPVAVSGSLNGGYGCRSTGPGPMGPHALGLAIVALGLAALRRRVSLAS